MIVTKHSAEALASLNLAVSLTDFVTRMDELIRQALMIPLSVIMSDEFENSISQSFLAEENHSVEALRLR